MSNNLCENEQQPVKKSDREKAFEEMSRFLYELYKHEKVVEEIRRQTEEDLNNQSNINS